MGELYDLIISVDIPKVMEKYRRSEIERLRQELEKQKISSSRKRLLAIASCIVISISSFSITYSLADVVRDYDPKRKTGETAYYSLAGKLGLPGYGESGQSGYGGEGSPMPQYDGGNIFPSLQPEKLKPGAGSQLKAGHGKKSSRYYHHDCTKPSSADHHPVRRRERRSGAANPSGISSRKSTKSPYHGLPVHVVISSSKID